MFSNKTSERILTIDIGAVSFKVAEFYYPSEGGEIVLDSFQYVNYGENTQDPEERLTALSTQFSKLVQKSNFKSKTIYLSISGQSTFIRFVKLPPTSKEEQKVEQLVEFEAKSNVPYPIEEVTWDYQLIGSPKDENEEIEVMFSVIKNETISRIINIIESKDFKVELVDITPSCTYNCARANRIGEDESSILINIGAQCTTLSFIDKGKFFARIISLGGNTITHQIMKELNIDYNKAEEMKKDIGFVSLEGSYDEAVSKETTIVSKIIRNVMTRLHGELIRSINLYKSQQKGRSPTKIYLAGGSSVITFTARFLATKLKVPAEFFNPFKVVSLSSSINKEELADYAHMTTEVIGLGLRNATTCPIEINMLPETIRKKHIKKQKMPLFIAICITLIISLFFVYWGINKQFTGINNIKKDVSGELKVLKGNLQRMNGRKKALKNTEEAFSKYKNALQPRNKIPNILNNFQSCLPDNTWIVSFKPITGSTGGKTKSSGGGGLFGSSNKSQNKTTKRKFIKGFRLKGHSLVINKDSNKSSAERLKDNLKNSEYFADNESGVSITSFSPVISKFNNITTFEMTVMLKNSLSY